MSKIALIKTYIIEVEDLMTMGLKKEMIRSYADKFPEHYQEEIGEIDKNNQIDIYCRKASPLNDKIIMWHIIN